VLKNGKKKRITIIIIIKIIIKERIGWKKKTL
jgi:hypothetical protein